MILLSGLFAGVTVFVLGFTVEFIRQWARLAKNWTDGTAFGIAMWGGAQTKTSVRHKFKATFLSMGRR